MIKVLIIDDEPLQRQGIVRMTPWTDFDAEVVGDTGSGMEGILLARRLRPDVLIVDITMPGISGREVIEQTQEERDGRPTIRIPQEEPGRGYLLHAVRYMEEHMEHSITVREVAEELGISVSYLHKLFARCGTSFSAYLTECRLHRAGKMLRESDEKIYVIESACGYQDTRYFSKIFQKHTGLKPTEYRSEKIS